MERDKLVLQKRTFSESRNVSVRINDEAADIVNDLISMPESPLTLKVGSRRLLPTEDYDKFLTEYFKKEATT